MIWYTCTPVAFRGGSDFFSRDSGLLSRGFRSLGIDSRAVMPGPRKAEDLDELIRTSAENLESSDWWRELKIDGLVLYAWGRPQFRGVAAAIRDAGIRLVLNQDSGGVVSPRLGLGSWLEEQRRLSGVGQVAGGRWGFLKRVVKGLSAGMIYTDPLRARHLRLGDYITAVSPVAAERYRRLGNIYGGRDLSGRVAFVPHPVDPQFSYWGEGKEHRIVSIGRWDDECQKRTGMLMNVLEEVLEVDEELEVDLVGVVSSSLRDWYDRLEDGSRRRVKLWGRVPPEKIIELLQKSKVSYCSSAFESFHIASAEALCCGLSVVAGRSVSLASFEWFVSDGDGSLAESDDVAGHVVALREELEAWKKGRRDPAVISNRWCERVHAPQVAASILALFDQAGQVGGAK